MSRFTEAAMMLKLASFLGAAAFLAAAIGVSGQSPERPAGASGGGAACAEGATEVILGSAPSENPGCDDVHDRFEPVALAS